ncbi:MAG: alpha/beta fold hydrolase [Flavobacteriaceae bacterium]
METANKNKASVKAFFKALEDENVEDLVNLFAEDANHINPYHSGIFPKGAKGKEEIRAYWTPVFPNFEGMSFNLQEVYAMEDPNMVFVKYQGDIKLKEKAGIYSNQYYSTFKFNKKGEIIEYVEIFNPIVAAKGFGLLDKIKQTVMKKNVTFRSEGLELAGHLYYPSDFTEGKEYPALVISGSWTTVKEQMAGLYAEKLSEKGFITLAFDFRNFGESEGNPRYFESPSLKKVDIENAVEYLESLPEVSNSKIGAFGVCAGAMYTVMAAAEDDKIKAVVTAASWLHDAEAVKLFYGGEEGVQAKIKAAQNAKRSYAETGIIDYIPAISETDENAAMFGPYDYYLNPERGAIKEWSNDKFAVASWEDWLLANPMPSAKKIDQPILMIHSDGAVLPNYTKKFFDELSSADKKLHWLETELESPFHQFSFYDQEEEVNTVVEEASKWFRSNL